MTKIESIHFTYAELFQNVFKRLLLLAGKLAGYKGFAVLIATVLLRLGYIGDAAWASVVISALCGTVLPKALGSYAAMDSSMDVGCKENEPFSYNAKNSRRGSGGKHGFSGECRKIVSDGKSRIRNAVKNAGLAAGSDSGQ